MTTEMSAIVLALCGLPAGLVVDWLITLLAVPLRDEADDVDEAERGPAQHLQSEAGLLAVTDDRRWLQRAVVVGSTVALFALAGERYGNAGQLAVVTPFLCVLIICAATDILTLRVPNVVTYPAILGALLVAAFMPGGNLISALAGAALAGVILLVPSLLTGGLAMGMGDVKLAVFVGLALGSLFIVPALVFMALAGGVLAAVLLLTGARKRRQTMPYAPFISAGAIATLLWQGTVFVSLH